MTLVSIVFRHKLEHFSLKWEKAVRGRAGGDAITGWIKYHSWELPGPAGQERTITRMLGYAAERGEAAASSTQLGPG